MRILESRDGRASIVELASGERLKVHNIAWGRDMGEDWEHITTNVSPDVPGESIDWFLTSDVVRVIDPTNGSLLWSGLGPESPAA